jgi:hypothetical protein
MLWLPGRKRIFVSPCTNVTHARTFAHVTYQLAPFHSLNATVHGHIITLFSSTLCATTLCHHHVDVFPSTQIIYIVMTIGNTRQPDDDIIMTKRVNENKCVMRPATGTRVTE